MADIKKTATTVGADLPVFILHSFVESGVQQYVSMSSFACAVLLIVQYFRIKGMYMPCRRGGRGETPMTTRLVQEAAKWKTSHDLSWKSKVMIKTYLMVRTLVFGIPV